MSAISNISYVLPPRRPWDPSRFSKGDNSQESEWREGQVIKGHPNICPLLDFFEDNHYYYLILPSTTPDRRPNEPAPPSDLFDLVETYPHGLPPSLIRTYLGQIADAMCFLHAQGIGECLVIPRKLGCSKCFQFTGTSKTKMSFWDLMVNAY